MVSLVVYHLKVDRHKRWAPDCFSFCSDHGLLPDLNLAGSTTGNGTILSQGLGLAPTKLFVKTLVSPGVLSQIIGSRSASHPVLPDRAIINRAVPNFTVLLVGAVQTLLTNRFDGSRGPCHWPPPWPWFIRPPLSHESRSSR